MVHVSILITNFLSLFLFSINLEFYFISALISSLTVLFFFIVPFL
jgi:hypothetical protein